jgi:hypothetical protein
MAYRLSLFAFLTFLLLTQTCAAMSVGTVVKQDSISLNANEAGKFTILLWTTDNSSYNVNLNIEQAPKGWLVSIQPRDFFLNSTSGNEYIKLPYVNGYSKAVAVNIFVKPNSAASGKYNIIIKATAGLPAEGLSFLQERKFVLTVEIPPFQFLKEAQKQFANVRNELQPVAEELKVILPNYYFYILVVVGIFVVSFLIYKYA